VRKHPTIGKEIVEKIDSLRLVARIVEEHHEQVDGKGYPKGLKGNEILLEARILAVVDAYDAMRSDRPYRRALLQEEAIAELKENAGSQFDPLIVKVFLEILDKGLEPSALWNNKHVGASGVRVGRGGVSR